MKPCIDCGDPIPPGRLAAKPNAPRCFDCQEDVEKKGGHQRHRMSTDVRFKGDEIESMESELVRGDS